jgi:hypothetical protein
LDKFERRDFIHGLTYLADVFNHMNKINILVQGPEVSFMGATEKLRTFLAKLSIWKMRADTDILASLHALGSGLQTWS